MRHIRVLSEVPVMKNWYKNYTEMYIYILRFCLRFIKLYRSYLTNAQAIWKQRYKWIYKLIFIDIIDNIIYASRTCHQNSNQWQSSIIVMCLRLYHVTSINWQFLETRTSDRTLMGLDQLLKCLGFSLYPLLFFLYSPFNKRLTWVKITML